MMNLDLELEFEIERIVPVASRADALNDLAWKLRYREKERALRLCFEAVELSRSGELSDHPYLAGVATGLATCGVIQLYQFQLDEALQSSNQALALMENLPTIPAKADARSTISWIFLYLGDYLSALDYALPALQIAKDLHCKDRESLLHDAIGSIYCDSEDFQNSLENHREAMRIAAELGIPEVEMIACNNLANTLATTRDYAEALLLGERSIRIARDLGLLTEELVITTTVADTLVKMKAFGDADRYLQSAWDKIQAEGKSRTGNRTKPFYYLLMSMAGLNLEQGKFSAAESFLLQGLKVAQEQDYKKDQERCHEMLCKLYEQLDAPKKALEHYKQFHAIREVIAGAESARKIALLKAQHQSEISRRETEILRLQNIELRHENEERKRSEDFFKHMAVRDPLTNLFNRRQFFLLASQEYEHAIHHDHILSALMLDIDYFKEVNDRFGHLVGDKVLVAVSEIVQNTLRNSDILGRFGGEEFVAILSEMPTSQAALVGERLRKVVSGINFWVEDVPFSVTISVGVAEMPRSRNKGPRVSLEELIDRADKAMYIAKRSGRNTVRVYSDWIGSGPIKIGEGD